MERLDFASVMAVLRRIKERLLPLMPDSAMAAQELYDLVL